MSALQTFFSSYLLTTMGLHLLFHFSLRRSSVLRFMHSCQFICCSMLSDSLFYCNFLFPKEALIDVFESVSKLKVPCEYAIYYLPSYIEQSKTHKYEQYAEEVQSKTEKKLKMNKVFLFKITIAKKYPHTFFVYIHMYFRLCSPTHFHSKIT